MPFPSNVSPPNYVYLVLLIPPHKSTPIRSLRRTHLFLLMRGPAERTAADGEGRAVQDGAVVTSLHGRVLGDHGSGVLWAAQRIPGTYCNTRLWAPARLLLSALVGFCIFFFVLFFFFSLPPQLNCK